MKNLHPVFQAALRPFVEPRSHFDTVLATGLERLNHRIVRLQWEYPEALARTAEDFGLPECDLQDAYDAQFSKGG